MYDFSPATLAPDDTVGERKEEKERPQSSFVLTAVSEDFIKASVTPHAKG